MSMSSRIRKYNELYKINKAAKSEAGGSNKIKL
jgi:hypothetical protein